MVLHYLPERPVTPTPGDAGAVGGPRAGFGVGKAVGNSVVRHRVPRRLRAGVLGANDGIVSTAAVVVGVAGATGETGPVLIAGLAALVGGAISMALGEYVSVSSARDSERSQLDQERRELAELVGQRHVGVDAVQVVQVDPV